MNTLNKLCWPETYRDFTLNGNKIGRNNCMGITMTDLLMQLRHLAFEILDEDGVRRRVDDREQDVRRVLDRLHARAAS